VVRSGRAERTPAAVIDRLNTAINTILQQSETKKSFESQGMMPTGGTPERFSRRVRGDYDRWVVVVREAGIKPE
jgi:tripartite-type tricarboxylate transporter receptor subunit TctC